MEVLRAWHKFSAKVASTDLEGTSEEGIYDEDYQAQMRDDLNSRRKVQEDQVGLDHPIDDDEVFRAIRKLKCGKAPGEDGLLTDILKKQRRTLSTIASSDDATRWWRDSPYCSTTSYPRKSGPLGGALVYLSPVQTRV